MEESRNGKSYLSGNSFCPSLIVGPAATEQRQVDVALSLVEMLSTKCRVAATPTF